MFAKGSMTKGADVYYVQVEKGYGRGVCENPGLAHGTVIGGGHVQVIIKWDGLPDWGSRERVNYMSAESRYSPTPELAWQDALNRLQVIHDIAYRRWMDSAHAMNVAKGQLSK